jgi:phosphodiesterase/alkaline phosphatase D-like protein
MPSPSITFNHGVASGDPYTSSVILWTRITPSAEITGLVDVQWEVATSTDFAADSIVASEVFATNADRDWTVKVEADGLSADTPYYYRFRAGDGVSMTGQTKTLPVGSDPVRLAVFSCANFPAAEQFAAYGRAAAIHAVNPYDALLHLGDYIYEYGPGGYGDAEDAAADRGFRPNREIVNLDDYRQRYAQYHTDPNLQILRATAPLIAIWDDHETANDSWAGGAQNHQSETEGSWTDRRDAALQAYYEWLPIRDPGQRQASDGATTLTPLSQGYRSFNFGDVLALHILETRLTARDEQLAYPDAAAVQARIGAILADPVQVAAYAAQLGLSPPADPAAIPAFAAALAPAVTQELVIATVQQAWGDPSRDLIGDSQLAWLQQQMASSNAAWQVLGQQVLMQSMAVPAELLLNTGDPALLDTYAAPLQKLATGTAFADLTAAEQALFAEAGKIPYNLDAWDGYGVERETILQSALALGKRLISLAGDTHNAWAGVLDTMSAGSRPAGTVAGVEFATPGVTSPGLEKYLPGADAYIRAFYPAVDGLDGLFMGYVDGLKYADVNRRGFLDLTVSTDEAVGTFVFLDGVDSFTGLPQWAHERVIAASDLSLSLEPEATAEISWQPNWRELDLVFGLALDAAGSHTLLDPADVATLPRSGVQLADVTVLGSDAGERIFAGVGSLIDGAAGDDDLFNTDSQGDNRLVGGLGADRLFLRPGRDQVIGGQLFKAAAGFGLSPFTALVDRRRDSFLIDGSDLGTAAPLQILDFEPGTDALLVDGLAPAGDWAEVLQQLQGLNVAINAAPQLSDAPISLTIHPGQVQTQDLSPFVSDADGDSLQLLKLHGPDWITTTGTTLVLSAPADLSADQLAASEPLLGFSDGRAVADFRPTLNLAKPPLLAIAAAAADRPEGSIGSTPFTFTISRSGDASMPAGVSWAVTGSGARPANALDFAGSALPSGTASFLSGQRSQSIIVNVLGDRLHERDETFSISLSNPVDAILLAGSTSAEGRIHNDDADSPASYSFSVSARTVQEGGILASAVQTTNVAPGTRIYWRFSGIGITANDFSDGVLSGAIRIGSDGRAGLSKAIAADNSPDPNETLKLRFYRDGAYRERLGSSLRIRITEPSVGVITDGNDLITGTPSSETLRGVPAGSTLRGRGSLDQLSGGSGDDLFLLGDPLGRFYDDGSTGLGTGDLAVIADFSSGDRIQLYGSSADYRLTSGRYSGVPGMRIDALNPTAQAIGFVQGATTASLNLTDPGQFLFV